jgi:hypothetical protein
MDQGRSREEGFGYTMTRLYTFKFTIECAGQGDADLARVEQLLDLSMQDLVEDDEFIAALDETTSVTIQVTPQIG